MSGDRFFLFHPSLYYGGGKIGGWGAVKNETNKLSDRNLGGPVSAFLS